MAIHSILFAESVTIKSLFVLQSVRRCDTVAAAPGAAPAQSYEPIFSFLASYLNCKERFKKESRDPEACSQQQNEDFLSPRANYFHAGLRRRPRFYGISKSGGKSKAATGLNTE